jgi:hypothetical protein
MKKTMCVMALALILSLSCIDAYKSIGCVKAIDNPIGEQLWDNGDFLLQYYPGAPKIYVWVRYCGEDVTGRSVVLDRTSVGHPGFELRKIVTFMH